MASTRRRAEFHALLELDGEPAGHASYRVKGDWEEGFPQSRLRVIDPVADLAARSPRALALPLRRRSRPARPGVAAPPGPPFVSTRVGAAEAAHEDRRRSVAPHPRRRRSPVGSLLRRGGGAGVRALSTPSCRRTPGCGGWRRETAARRSSAERGRPRFASTVQALASVFLGGFSFAELQAARLVDELEDGAVATADALFRIPRAPWCLEVFLTSSH